MPIKLDFKQIRKFAQNDNFIVSNHARTRMFERNVSTEEIKNIIEKGEIIEQYPDDFPCPSVLILGTVNDNYFHIVVAQCYDHVRIITVYEPDETKWIEFRKRKD